MHNLFNIITPEGINEAYSIPKGTTYYFDGARSSSDPTLMMTILLRNKTNEILKDEYYA